MIRKLVKTSAKFNGKIGNAISYLSVGFLMIMMFLGTGDVAGRYLFNRPITGTKEAFEVLLPAIGLLGLGFVQSQRAHIFMEFILDRLSSRVQDILRVFSDVCSLFFSILIVYHGLLLVFTYHDAGTRISNIGLPLYIPQILVPIGAFFLCLVLTIQLIEDSLKIWGTE